MLDNRHRDILTALVREYVRSAHPVGSKVLVEHYDLGCSPATVRNDLAALEESGHVYQPHVSAGRVPTDAGYRAFVDDIRDASGEFAGDEVDTVRARLRVVETELTDLMRETATLLTKLTSYAAVVMAPTLKRSRVRRIDLVPLSSDRVLIVLITDTGQVAKRIVDLGEPVDESELADIEGSFNRALTGQVADELREIADDLARQATRAGVWLTLVDEILVLLSATDETAIYHGGTAALLGEPEFEDPEMVRSIVGLLEDGLALVRTFSEVGRARDVLVRIGAENALAELGQMSVVLAPYGGPGATGYLGLVGPTRMDYARAITSVRCVAETLTDTFTGRGR